MYSLFTAGHPAGHLDAVRDPLDLFLAFLSDQDLEVIRGHTNVKLRSIRSTIGDANRETATYSDMTLIEFKAFIACLIMAGIRNDNHLNTDQMFSEDFGITMYQ